MIKAALFNKHNAHLVDVVCDMDTTKLPLFQIDGVPAHRSREMAERVRSALVESGFEMPRCRITVRISEPEGEPFTVDHPGLDLAVALALLWRMRVLDAAQLAGLVVHGQLGLDGTIQPVRGSVPVAVAAHDAGLSMLVSAHSEADCALAGVPVAGVRSLSEAIEWLRSDSRTWYAGVEALPQPKSNRYLGAVEVPAHVAMQVANAALTQGAGMIIYARPHSQTTALGVAFHEALGAMNEGEAVRSAARFSSAGLDVRYGVRPFRAPHHTVTKRGLFGDRRSVGELGLAFGGTLFLDDVTSFRPDVLRSLSRALDFADLDGPTRLVVVVYVSEDEPRPWERIPRAVQQRCPVQVWLTDPPELAVPLTEVASDANRVREGQRQERVTRVLSALR